MAESSARRADARSLGPCAWDRTAASAHDRADRIDHYNHRRLHSAIGYITPHDKLAGLETEIWAERDRKLEQARELRRKRRELDHAGIAA